MAKTKSYVATFSTSDKYSSFSSSLLQKYKHYAALQNLLKTKSKLKTVLEIQRIKVLEFEDTVADSAHFVTT